MIFFLKNKHLIWIFRFRISLSISNRYIKKQKLFWTKLKYGLVSLLYFSFLFWLNVKIHYYTFLTGFESIEEHYIKVNKTFKQTHIQKDISLKPATANINHTTKLFFYSDRQLTLVQKWQQNIWFGTTQYSIHCPFSSNTEHPTTNLITPT